jgi:ADP-ribose pyrophosphatase
MWTGGVRAIIFDRDDKLLMVRQHHEGRDIWMVPGGAIEEGENSKDAVMREVMEETGLIVSVGKMLWHVEEASEERGQRFVNYFVAGIIGGQLELGNDPEFDGDHQVLCEATFVSRDEMQNLQEVFPDILRDELWEIKNGAENDVFREREQISI